MDKRQDVIDVGIMVRPIMCNLVNGDDFPIVGEHHCSKQRIGYFLHSINVAMSKQDILIKWGVDKLNVYEDGFSSEFDVEILEEILGEDDRPS
jgi:hypothetical protein